MVTKEADRNAPLVCPVCEQSLFRNDTTYLCANGHSFDLAKEGYVNLLLSHLRRSKHPGDSADMVQARQTFLDSGAFAPLSELIQSEVQQLPAVQKKDRAVTIMDAGCGEGYFLDALQKIIMGQCYGIDLSKEAIRLAARRHSHARWVVANVMRRIPFANDSMDIILSILAPRNVDEFARILKPTGSLMLVVPGPNHLIELRSRKMADAGTFQIKADAAVKFLAPHFSPQRRIPLEHKLLLNKSLLTELVQMTPLFWRSTREAKADIANLDELRVTINFVLLTFHLIC